MGVVAYLSLSGSGREEGWGGHLFEAGRLLTFSAFRVGAYSRLGAYSNKYGLWMLDNAKTLGDTPGNSWWGCAAPDPISDQKRSGLGCSKAG